MAKRSRNKQAARERIARMRAEQARRRRRRIRLASSAAAAAVIAVAAGIALAVTSGGSTATGLAPSGLNLAPLSTLGALQPAPAPGATGSEGVPVPAAAPLVGLATAATGQPVDQISCQTSEQTLFHIHAHLAIFVNGKARQVPAAIGVPGARAQQTPNGPFIAAGTCFYWLHTHASDGIIHIESPVQRTYTLGEFFDEWGQPLGPAQVGPATGRVVALYDGKVYQGNPRDIPLTAHAQIQLDIGTPLIAPQPVTFPAGL
ncbi:MAG TPA: hypothetical protein VG123_17155 [Streptosporangiaceae bacterium]|jgi:hypothetical protein|nr:hypothetical protein [Streptosporangiaceae bacterium]